MDSSDIDFHLIHASLGSGELAPKRYLDRLAVLAYTAAKATFQWGVQSLKTVPFFWGYAPLSNTWFLGLHPTQPPNGTSIGSAVFAGITNATNRQTDRQTDRPRCDAV